METLHKNNGYTLYTKVEKGTYVLWICGRTRDCVWFEVKSKNPEKIKRLVNVYISTINLFAKIRADGWEIYFCKKLEFSDDKDIRITTNVKTFRPLSQKVFNKLKAEAPLLSPTQLSQKDKKELEAIKGLAQAIREEQFEDYLLQNKRVEPRNVSQKLQEIKNPQKDINTIIMSIESL